MAPHSVANLHASPTLKAIADPSNPRLSGRQLGRALLCRQEVRYERIELFGRLHI
jgi:hypothetical protein